jgi:lauroyl/myristoyl acyltransferase
MAVTDLLPPAATAASGPGPASRVHWLNQAPFYRAAAAVAARLPRGARLPVAGALGRVLARAFRREAAVVRANLARVVPGLSAEARARQVRELFGHFAMCVADLLPVRFVTLRSPADSLPLVAALRRGEIVGMQGDRALGHRGDVPVPFFGAPVLFPLGPFLLARAAAVPVLPAFCVLRADRRYAVHVQAPLRVERGEEEAALHRWVHGLGAVIARHPTQWFSFFDPWSVQHAR